MSLPDSGDVPSGLSPRQACPLIVHATNGKKGERKVKLSAIVEPGELEAFYMRLADVCKTGMTLRPRDKNKKRAKAKKAAARKKKAAATQPA